MPHYIILWHAALLLDNNHKISNYTIAAAKKWLCKQRPLLDYGSVAITPDEREHINCNVTKEQCFMHNWRRGFICDLCEDVIKKAS
jgi:plasmid rolling circle replication initiator protein Rep